MTEIEAVVLGFDYPGPGSVDRLRRAVISLPTGPVRDMLRAFVNEIGRLELGEWEELHTRTLDLSPLFVPYVGHVTWGENYRRGAFMAELQRAQTAAGVDQAGELPDHLVPVLRLLAAGSVIPSDLIDVLPEAARSMRRELREADSHNPYRHLLSAAIAAIEANLGEGAST
jgi:nitrate reductase delta subunit